MSVDGPPLTPDADTARRWAVDELAKDEYTQGGDSWLDRVLAWFQRLLDGIGDGVGGALGPTGVVVAWVVAAAVVAVVVWLVVGPLRRSRRASVAAGLFEDERTAAALERAARDAADSGEWERATLDLYRATIRRLDERAVITLTPGVTALEAAGLAGEAVPSIGDRIATDADAFDGIRYGHATGTEATYAHVLETWRSAGAARRHVDARTGGE